MSSGFFTGMIAYQPGRSLNRIDVTVRLELSHTFGPKMQALWDKLGNNETTANYRQAVVNVMANDIVQSGMFTHVEPNPPSPDFIVQIVSEEVLDPQPTVRVNEKVLAPDKQVISDHTEQAVMGTSATDYKINLALPKVMAAIKADMMTDLLAFLGQRREKAEQAEAAAFAKAALPDLLASADRSVATARARNRAIIAAKDLQLPAILRDSKTDQLSALVVKIEQTILDLNHESEVANDHAQQVTAANGNPQQIDELRGLSISYRERIELLKPILAAVREEIANRSR